MNPILIVFAVTTPKETNEYEEYGYGENEDIFGFDITPTSELEVNTEDPVTTEGSGEETTGSLTERSTVGVAEGSREETTERVSVTDAEVSSVVTTIETITEGAQPEAIFPADKVECSAKCEDEDYRPLCGDDGVTYSSLCHLQVHGNIL